MPSGRFARLALAAALGTALPVTMLGYLSGLDAGVAGVPGEDSCTRGHNPAGNATGALNIAFPGAQTYTPGVKQHLVITLADSAARRWGFQSPPTRLQPDRAGRPPQ